jgi:hypothetical protein
MGCTCPTFSCLPKRPEEPVVFIDVVVGRDKRRVLFLNPFEKEMEKIIQVCWMNWLGWTKNLMGFRSSPFNSVKMYLIVEEVVKGDRHDVLNPFQWDHIRLNLPETKEYMPSQAWITKRRKDNTLASDLVDFVDDKRLAGAGKERVEEAGHAVSTRESYLGLQDALRKIRPATRQPGAWAG